MLGLTSNTPIPLLLLYLSPAHPQVLVLPPLLFFYLFLFLVLSLLLEFKSSIPLIPLLFQQT
jgi:hypothetical protein